MKTDSSLFEHRVVLFCFFTHPFIKMGHTYNHLALYKYLYLKKAMEDPNELVDKPEEILPNPEAVVPKALKKIEVLFMGLVENGYFKPVPDKLHTPPRWEQGTYSLAAGKWPSPALTTADLMDLTPYNGYSLMVMASEWNKEVISQARIFGVLDNTAHDVINKFAYLTLQEKEEEIAVYISGIGN